MDDELADAREPWQGAELVEPAGLDLSEAALRRTASDARAESRRAAERLSEAVNALLRKAAQ